MDTYQTRYDPNNPWATVGCIDICHADENGRWFALDLDFAHNAVRISQRFYQTRGELIRSLSSGRHSWDA